MYRVYLLRHGRAAHLAPGGRHDDEARELTGPGRQLLLRACATYARVLGSPPPRIWHSPLVRARQTAEILGAALGGGRAGPARQVQALVPAGRPGLVVELLQSELLAGAEAIVLVGHQPLLGDLAGLLISGNERASLALDPGSLVGLEFGDPHRMLGQLRVLLDQEVAAALCDPEGS